MSESTTVPWLHPVLSPEAAADWEAHLLSEDTEKTEAAMRRAGESLGEALLRDFNELAPLPRDPALLLLCGKGHNAGDALVAARAILRARPRGCVAVLFVFGETTVKPLVQTMLAELLQDFGDRALVEYLPPPHAVKVEDVKELLIRLLRDAGRGHFDMAVDGILGMQFKPPLREPLGAVLEVINGFERIVARASVDLPTGLGADMPDDAIAFRADFTYATGIAKTPLFGPAAASWVGRIRYLDIGFFEQRPEDAPPGGIVTPEVLAPLRRARAAAADKRAFGHVFVIGGARTMPGAAMMNARGALESGAGLVSAFVPESVAGAFAAATPEVMWVPWPETRGGGLALEGAHLLRERAEKAGALVMGSGMGGEEETRQLLMDLAAPISCPLVLDADALQTSIVEAVRSREGGAQTVLTPHAGEWKRLFGESGSAPVSDEALLTGTRQLAATVLLKGSVTRVCDGRRIVRITVGGPVQARGGSGDILAGILGAQLALTPEAPFAASCRAAFWCGRAAQSLARARGETAVRTTEILSHLAPALREG